MEAQGLFINLCSMYWSLEGNLSITKAKRRYNGCNTTVWKELIDEKIIKVKKDQIIINFLDEQFKERKKLSETNSENIKKRWKKAEKNTVVYRSNNDGKLSVYNIEEKRKEERREEEKYNSPQEAFEEISTNYKETAPHLTIVSNRGWKSASNQETNSLLFHFLETQIDFTTQSKTDVKLHFKRWLNKQPIEELQTLSKKINERFQAKVS